MGAPSPETTYSDPSQCAPAGSCREPRLSSRTNEDRPQPAGARSSTFGAIRNIKQEADLRTGQQSGWENFTLNPGLRFDNYNGCLTKKANAFQAARSEEPIRPQPLHTVFPSRLLASLPDTLQREPDRRQFERSGINGREH